MLIYTCFDCIVIGKSGWHAESLLPLLANKTDEREVHISSRKLMMLCATG